MYAVWGRALAPWVAPALLVAGISFVVMALIYAWIGRRRFYRRNIAGVQEFDSFGAAVGKTALEGVANLVGAAFATVFALSAVLAMAGLIFGQYK